MGLPIAEDVLTRKQLEFYFRKWEQDYHTKGDLNNPKINLSFVQQNGVLLYRNILAPKEDDMCLADLLGDVESLPTGEKQ